VTMPDCKAGSERRRKMIFAFPSALAAVGMAPP
jgi:hypothetical protein